MFWFWEEELGQQPEIESIQETNSLPPHLCSVASPANRFSMKRLTVEGKDPSFEAIPRIHRSSPVFRVHHLSEADAGAFSKHNVSPIRPADV